MTQRVAYYQMMSGLPGCLPNSHEFYSWHSRREMVQDVNRLLDFYGFPQRARRQVSIAEAWQYIQKGGKRGHFTIRGGQGNPLILEFIQLGADEWRKAASEES